MKDNFEGFSIAVHSYADWDRPAAQRLSRFTVEWGNTFQ